MKIISTTRNEIFLFDFQTTFPQEEHPRHFKPKREKEQPKREERRRSYEKKLKKEEEVSRKSFFPLLFSRISSHCLSCTAH